jgi:CPA2 family monovalent cation:H+ antiporter-2
MNHLTFLQDLAVVMIVAALVTVLFRRLKQPVVLGYIVAGIIIGKHTPPFALVSDEHAIETLSELGVIFLMFSLGLEFSLRKLRSVGATALIGATLEILVMLWAGYSLGRAFGWREMDSIFLGAILSISSTTIIIKALEELGKSKESFAKIIFGILIVEDLLAILMLALLSGYATTGVLSAANIGWTVLQLGAFLGALLVGGLILVPRFLNWVSGFKSNETLLVCTMGLCFGVSLLAVRLGYSVALGAFLIGAIIAEARQIAKIEALTHPVRDLFSAVFFVSIGLLINPRLLLQYAGPILLITAVVIVGKVAACSVGTFICGNGRRDSMRVGMGLAQIGEFSFIIASLGLSLKVTSDFLYPIAVAVSGLTTLFTPYLIRASDSLVAWFEARAPRRLSATLDAYTRWVGEIGGNREGGKAAAFLRKWGWQILLNLLLVTAVFITAGALRGRVLQWWPGLPGGEDGVKALLWLAATFLSLPMLIACVRKLEAMGMLLSEVAVNRARAGEATDASRAVIRHTVMALGCAVFLLFLLMLSSAILPSWKVLAGMVGLIILSVLLLRRSFTRLYSKAQAALAETFAEPSVSPPVPSTSIPAMLREAKLQVVALREGAPAAGKLIVEVQLRTETGASIVGIERDGENIVNPDPAEELRVGDRVLLLGTPEKLEAGVALLTGETLPRTGGI